MRLRLVAEGHGGEVGRELARQGVVFLRRLDEALARHRDAVLGAFELRLQLAEILVGLELRIVLGHGEQAREGAGHFALCLDEALEGFRIVHGVGVDLHRGRLGARFGDADQHVLFLLGEALHRVDEVGNQVGAPLVLVDHLGPGALHLLVGGLQLVVAATAQ